MGARVDRLVWVVAQLRRHCPWTRALTHDQLTEYLVEEAYEALEAIETGADDDTLRSELGDVLFQVVLHAAIAQDRGAFAMEDVAEAITAAPGVSVTSSHSWSRSAVARTSGSASWISLRIRASVFPRQSPRSAMRWLMLSEADDPSVEGAFFMCSSYPVDFIGWRS